MTGLTDSDANPVHSVADGKNMNLLEPASIEEYISKNRYPGIGTSIQKYLALTRIAKEKSGYYKHVWVEFCSLNGWGKTKKIFKILGIAGGVIGVMILMLMVYAYVRTIMDDLDPVLKNFLAGFSTLVLIPLLALRVLPILPDSPTILNEKFASNSRKILMDDINPKWINAYLIRAWPILKDTDNLDLETQNQTHQGIVERSLKFGKENSSWSTLNKYCLEFLIKWSMEKPDERIPMILWTFNPPGSESGKWGESREQHIEFAQHQFSNQIRESIQSMDKLTTRNKTLVDWEQNGYSFQWLKSQMTDKTPRNNTLVKTLTKWSSLES